MMKRSMKGMNEEREHTVLQKELRSLFNAQISASLFTCFYLQMLEMTCLRKYDGLAKPVIDPKPLQGHKLNSW